MLGAFGEVRKHVKWDAVTIDNTTFKLHYKVTFSILLLCCFMVTTKQFIGEPITCIVAELPNNVMDTYCWVHSTFTVPSEKTSKEALGHEFHHPGVAPLNEGEIIRHSYYQWVWAVLIFQCMLCYFPRYLWKSWEDGKLQTLIQGMNVPIVDKEVKKERIGLLVNYFTINKDSHDFYFLKFFVCEILNLVNVIGQVLLMNGFLNGQFTKYGLDVLAMTEQDFNTRHDPMARLFPKVAKCTINKSGPSGTVETLDGLCVLPLNIVNEKCYVFLWFWFMFVSAWSCIQIVYRLMTIFAPEFRKMLLKSQARLAPSRQVDKVCKKSNVGDWFLLYQLGKNMDPLIFKEFINKMYRKLEDEHTKTN